MHGHPTQGAKNSKPRLSSRPGPQIGELSEEYLRIRNAGQAAKTAHAQMVLAQRRGELIEKKLAFAQLSYLLISLRSGLLALPGAVAPRLANMDDVHAISEILRGEVLRCLEAVAELPSKVTDPHWLETVMAEEEQTTGERRQSPEELKSSEAKAAARRARQAELARKQRASGRI